MRIVRYFTKADTLLDVALRWGSLFAAIWGGSFWLAKKVNRLGEINWAEAVFLGLGVALLCVLVASFTLIAIRYFRPLPTDSREETLAALPDNHGPQIGSDALKADILFLNEKMENIANDQKALIGGHKSSSAQIGDLGERLGELSARLGTIQQSVEILEGDKSVNEKFARIDIAKERLDQMSGKLSEELESLPNKANQPATG